MFKEIQNLQANILTQLLSRISHWETYVNILKPTGHPMHQHV